MSSPHPRISGCTLEAATREKAQQNFVHVLSERQPLSVKLLQESVASAENVHKQFILAVVDEESDLTFYEIKSASPKGGEMPEPSLQSKPMQLSLKTG